MHQACQHRNNSTPRHKMQVTFIFQHCLSKVSWCKDIPIHYSNRSTAEIKLTCQIQSCAQVQSSISGFHAWRYIPLNACLGSPVEMSLTSDYPLCNMSQRGYIVDISAVSSLSPQTSRRRIASTSEIVFVP